MRRILFIILATTLSLSVGAHAQDATLAQHYSSDTLGVTFDYPADWQVQEQSSTRNIMAASKDDLDALKVGKSPSGLLFSIAMTNLHAMNIAGISDFASYLQRMLGSSGTAPETINVG